MMHMDIKEHGNIVNFNRTNQLFDVTVPPSRLLFISKVAIVDDRLVQRIRWEASESPHHAFIKEYYYSS
jgi:hypothetical protein